MTLACLSPQCAQKQMPAYAHSAPLCPEADACLSPQCTSVPGSRCLPEPCLCPHSVLLCWSRCLPMSMVHLCARKQVLCSLPCIWRLRSVCNFWESGGLLVCFSYLKTIVNWPPNLRLHIFKEQQADEGFTGSIFHVAFSWWFANLSWELHYKQVLALNWGQQVPVAKCWGTLNLLFFLIRAGSYICKGHLMTRSPDWMPGSVLSLLSGFGKLHHDITPCLRGKDASRTELEEWELFQQPFSPLLMCISGPWRDGKMEEELKQRKFVCLPPPTHTPFIPYCRAQSTGSANYNSKTDRKSPFHRRQTLDAFCSAPLFLSGNFYSKWPHTQGI